MTTEIFLEHIICLFQCVPVFKFSHRLFHFVNTLSKYQVSMQGHQHQFTNITMCANNSKYKHRFVVCFFFQFHRQTNTLTCVVVFIALSSILSARYFVVVCIILHLPLRCKVFRLFICRTILLKYNYSKDVKQLDVIDNRILGK